MWNPNIETFLACDADYSEATTVLFGAPYDSTTSFRPGTRFGPHAIRSESFGLESYSPYQDRDLTDYAILDIGDMELRFGGRNRRSKILKPARAHSFGWKTSVSAGRRTSGHTGRVPRRSKAISGRSHHSF